MDYSVPSLPSISVMTVYSMVFDTCLKSRANGFFIWLKLFAPFSFLLFTFSLISFYRLVGAGVFGLIRCQSLSPRMAFNMSCRYFLIIIIKVLLYFHLVVVSSHVSSQDISWFFAGFLIILHRISSVTSEEFFCFFQGISHGMWLFVCGLLLFLNRTLFHVHALSWLWNKCNAEALMVKQIIC